MDNRKNVLMICVDQLSFDKLGFSGNTNVMTPTIDFLASNGLNFDNTYSTCPICIPARRSIMTGMSPKSHGDRVYSETMRMPETKTIAQTFVDAGYQAYAVGKLHVYPQRDRIGFNDVVLMEEGRNEFGVYDDYQIWLGKEGSIADEFSHTIGNNNYHTRTWHLPEKAHWTTWATNEMLRMMTRVDPDKPSFFYISYPAPHPPLVPLQVYYDMYNNEEMILPEESFDNWYNDGSYIMNVFNKMAEGYSEKEKRMAYRAYYAQCTHIDNEIRLLIGCLRETNRLQNTVIAFVSDHGDMLFEHGFIGKRLFYEGSAHVPFIISGEPVQKYRGKVEEHMVASLEDVMPTLLDICEIDIPKTVDGISLVSGDKHEYIFGEITEGTRATRMITDGRYKLIYYPCGNIVHLFDMDVDKEEKNNLASDSAYSDLMKKLTSVLIFNLHSGDEEWVENGVLRGFNPPTDVDTVDFGMHNQRGTHWPPLGKYSNFGNTTK